MATSDFPGLLTLSLWQALVAGNPIRCMLTDGSWAMDKDTSQYVSEVTGEVTGTGYTAGGQALASVTETYDAASDTTVVDAADPSWDATGGELSASGAVFYVDTGTASTSPIVSVWAFTSLQTATNAAFTVNIDAAGFVNLS